MFTPLSSTLTKKKKFYSIITTEVIKELFLNLDEELNTVFKANASENLEKIQKLFSIIGVSIRLSGKLPDDTTTKNILFEIIREASTNAVKHGNAKEINIQTYTEDKTFFMIISNDEKPITVPIKEGNGR